MPASRELLVSTNNFHWLLTPGSEAIEDPRACAQVEKALEKQTMAQEVAGNHRQYENRAGTQGKLSESCIT